MRQAIIWIKDGKFTDCMHIYASLDLNELMYMYYIYIAECLKDARMSSKHLTMSVDIGFTGYIVQWNPSIKATQGGALSKEVACHEG